MLIANHARPDEPFEQRRVQRLQACMSIPAHEFRTAMLFNPAGYRTSYNRSVCLQQLAIDEHDAELCLRVRERKSWFFDGSSISPDACKARVGEVVAADRKALAQFLETVPYRIDSIVVRRNGNGKDYDVLLNTAGVYHGRYVFTLSARRAPKSISILDSSHYLGPTTGRLQLLLRATDLEGELGADWATKEWRMRGELSLLRDEQNRFWYDRIPGDAVTDSSEFTISFDKLAPWVPEPVG
jgi:hypothetical protein